MSLSSRRIQRSSPTSPCSAKPGARRLLDRKRALPLPPVPPAAASHRSPSSDQVGQEHAVAVDDLRSDRYGDQEVVAAVAVPLLAPAVRPAGGLAVRMVPERQQRRRVAVGDQPDIAAAAAVTAVGAAHGDVRLAAERHATRAAVTALDVDGRTHRRSSTRAQDTGRPARHLFRFRGLPVPLRCQCRVRRITSMTQRAQNWAATMGGHREVAVDDRLPVRRAHADSDARLGADALDGPPAPGRARGPDVGGRRDPGARSGPTTGR